MSYIKALLKYPESLYRESYFETAEYEKKNNKEDYTPTWFGWGNLEIILGQFINLYITSHSPESKKKSLINSPPIKLPGIKYKKAKKEFDNNAMQQMQQDFLKAMENNG